MNKIEEIHLLSSLAVFSQTYKNNTDIIDVIAAFIEATIVKRSLKSFTCAELTTHVNSEFSFTFPEGVIATSIKRISHLERTAQPRTHYIYTPDEQQQEANSKLLLEISNAENKNKSLFNELERYVASKIKRDLSENELDELIHSFTSFIQDTANGRKFSEHISAFIIKNSEKKEFIEHIQEIKDGSIIESGIRFNNNISEKGSWKKELTILVGTEIIFHLAGYNGQVFKKITDEFLGYISEINSGRKEKIKLRYFNETLEGINAYFSKAEDIVAGKEKALPHVSAMVYLTNGCESRFDLLRKKKQLMRLLEVKGIKQLEDENFFSEDNHKYNIINSSLINEIQANPRNEFMENHINELNYINILRKGESHRFDSITHILVTENYKTLSIAWNPSLKEKGEVPLATNLNFMISKFWFKLNRGFGQQGSITSFDVITKAKIVLSSRLNESVSKRYSEFKQNYASGTLDRETATAILAECRSDARKPEEIRAIETEQILSLIEDSSIDAYLRNKEHLEQVNILREQENTSLANKLALEKEKSNQKTNKLIEEKNTSKKLYIEKKINATQQLKNITTKKSIITNDFYKRKKQTKITLILLAIILTPTVYYHLSEDIEKIKNTFNLFGGAIIIAFILWCLGDKIKIENVKNTISNIEKKYLDKRFAEEGLSMEVINRVEDEIKELDIKIFNLDEDITALELEKLN